MGVAHEYKVPRTSTGAAIGAKLKQIRWCIPLQVFQFLTAWAGDAYLQYSTDKRLLFTMGVSLSVRPDQHRFILWGPGRGCHA